MNNKESVKFCLTAFTDLLGFASHLEVGADLRTNIGQQATDRLRNLEEVITYIENEKKSSPEHYPEKFFYSRINDSIILTMDLPDIFVPEIGETKTRAVTNDFFNEVYAEVHQEFGENVTSEQFSDFYTEKVIPQLNNLCLFIGLVTRLHQFLSKRENAKYFPGPKTVISTGYRKVFIDNTGKEDFLSANFAFSNAYLAESKLKGSKVYIDNHLLQLLSLNPFGKNIVRYGLFVDEDPVFDPTKEYEDILFLENSKVVIPSTVQIELFRKQYIFREVNPRLFSLFHVLPYLYPYLKGTKKVNILEVYIDTFNAIAEQKTFEEVRSSKHHFISTYTDISVNIKNLRDRLTDKDSIFLKEIEEERKKEFMSKVLSTTVTVSNENAKINE